MRGDIFLIIAIAIIIAAVFLILLVIRLALKLAWGILKFLFSLGLFAICPILFLLLGVLGLLGSAWWVILLAAILCGIGFGKS